MAFQVDDIVVGGQMKTGTGICPATGEGPVKVNGSSMIEGPVVIGNPTTFPYPYVALNVGPLVNSDAPTPIVPGGLCFGINNPYSFSVSGPSALMGNVDVQGNVTAAINVQAQGDVIGNCGRHLLSLKKIFLLTCLIPIKRDGDSAMFVLKDLRLPFIVEEEFLQTASFIFQNFGKDL